MKKLIVSGYEPSGTCDLSEKEGVEVLIVSTDDKTIDQARMSFREFEKQVRFSHKQSRNGSPAPTPPATK